MPEQMRVLAGVRGRVGGFVCACVRGWLDGWPNDSGCGGGGGGGSGGVGECVVMVVVVCWAALLLLRVWTRWWVGGRVVAVVYVCVVCVCVVCVCGGDGGREGGGRSAVVWGGWRWGVGGGWCVAHSRFHHPRMTAPLRLRR